MSTFFAQNPAQPVFDWQGHRGCRGLMPENSIPAFLKALEFPVTTLELDVAVSKDNRIIISHEPWFSEEFCAKPDGSPVTKTEAMSLKIKDLTYEEIKKFDCGSRAHPRFPQQQKMAVHKPSLWDMVQAVKEHCRQQNRPLPYFNIEIKSHPSGDGLFTPPVEEFANLLLHEIEALGIAGLTCIQSFDVRALQAVKKQKSAAITALLVENKDSFQENIGRLGYQPEIYSCHFKLLRKKHVKKLHAKGIRVIPWTVNTAEDMRKLVKWGVDGIITDYPNLIEKS